MSGMTCKEAELLLETGTRIGQVEPPQTRHPQTRHNDGLDQHLRACQSCASVARDLRMMQSALAGLKNAFEEIESPGRVKAALLKRFRNPVIDYPVPPPANAARAIGWWYAGAASAAMLLVGFAVWYHTSQPRVLYGAPGTPASHTLGVHDFGSKDFGFKDVGGKGLRANSAKVLAAVHRPDLRSRVARKGNHQGASKTFEMAQATVETPTPKAAGGPGTNQLNATELGEEEVRTEFVALQPESAEDSIDGESIVRMKLPASSVGSVGLPVVEDSSHQVTADVVVDQFGNAQAIRFVRPAGSPRHVEGFR